MVLSQLKQEITRNDIKEANSALYKKDKEKIPDYLIFTSAEKTIV